MPRRRCGWRRTSCPCARRFVKRETRALRNEKREAIMKAEKIRNQTDAELHDQERELADQLFKLKFQLNMGQTESLKKIRGLRKDIARVKTIVRRARIARRTGDNGEEVMAEQPAQQGGGTAQGSGRRSGLQQDAQDHRGRGDAQEGAPVLRPRGLAQPRSSMRTTRRTKRTWATWCGSKRPVRCRS